MFKFLFPSFPGGRGGTALLLLRGFVGIAFLFHGYGKIVGIPAFAAEFGLALPVAAAAAYTQFACGLLMILGALTPLAGAALAATMAAATFELIGRGEPFVSPHGHSWEAAAFYLVAASALALLGPGRYSIDSLLAGRKAAAINPPAVDDGRLRRV